MIWTIALGILLGYILIGLLPVVSELLNAFFAWLFDIIGEFFGFLSKIYKQIKKMNTEKIKKIKWYYKVIIFVLGFYIFAELDWIDLLCCWFLFFGVCFLLWLFEKWHQFCEKIEHHTEVKKK